MSGWFDIPLPIHGEQPKKILMLLGPPDSLLPSNQPTTLASFLISSSLNYSAEQRALEATDEQPGGYTGLNWEEAEPTDGLLTPSEIKYERVGCIIS